MTETRDGYSAALNRVLWDHSRVASSTQFVLAPGTLRQVSDSSSISWIDGVAWASLRIGAMAPTSHAATLPSGRGRRILIALLILLLILLPLYLWPLRAGLGALPWGSALTGGVPTDPRNASALAGIPGEVWDALMSQAANHHPPPGPRNLTMITEHEGKPGPSLAPDSIGSLSALLSGDGSPPGPSAAVTDAIGGEVGEGDSSLASTPDQLGSLPTGEGQATAGSWPGGGGAGGGGIGGHRGGFQVPLENLPAGDPAPGFRGPVLVLVPGDPIAPHPTPEPGTIALVGVNGMVIAVLAWKHRRNKEERTATR
jgi:hypothetical protein